MPFHDFFPSPKGDTDFYALPFGRRLILYRPQLPLAFLANRVMAELAAEPSVCNKPSPATDSAQAMEFLNRIGFFASPAAPVADEGEVKQYRPSIAVLLLTTSCQLRCSYCYASAGEARHRMPNTILPLAAGKAAIDVVCRNAREKGEKEYSLSFHGGGEPVAAFPLLRRLTEYARGKDLPVRIHLSSNGFWEEAERDWILENIDDLGISCDGLPEVHDRQRPQFSGEGSFARIFANLQEMDRRRVSYGLRLTVTEETIDTLPQSIEFLCQETLCGTMQAEPAFDHGRARTGGRSVKSGRRFAGAFLSAYDIAADRRRYLFYSGARPQVLTSTFCQAPETALIVNNEGKLTACYEIFHSSLQSAPHFFIGEVDSSGQIAFDEKKRIRLREMIRERRRLCRGCFCYWHCAGDCPAKTITGKGGSHLRFGLRCRINREITRGLLIRHIHRSGGIWQG